MNSVESTQMPELADAMPWRKFLETPEGQRFFPTDNSLAWFMRGRERLLVDQGALIRVRNQWFIVRPRFVQVALDVFSHNAKSEVQRKHAWMGQGKNHD